MSRLSLQLLMLGLVAGVLWRCSTVQAKTSSKEFTWKIRARNYLGKRTRIEQSAMVFSSTQRILMKANDSNYRETPTYRSTSLLDFQAGRVAFKPLGARHCFLGRVRKTFQETVDELTKRATGATPNLERRTVLVTGVRSWLAAGSRALRGFCFGRRLLLLTDQNFDTLPEQWIRWAPLDSIWGQVDPYRTVPKLILSERDVPLSIRWKVGPNVPFP